MTKFNYPIILLSFFLVINVACKEKTTQNQMVKLETSYQTSLDFNRSVFQILDQSPKYNSFLKLVNSVSYFDEIKAMNNIMVFVPTDEAFGPSKLLINELSTPDKLDRLKQVLEYHIVKADFDVENLLSDISMSKQPLRLQTVNGGFLAISLDAGKLKILDESTGITLINKSSIRGSNGVVYTIDRLLQPNEDDALASRIADSE